MIPLDYEINVLLDPKISEDSLEELKFGLMLHWLLFLRIGRYKVIELGTGSWNYSLILFSSFLEIGIVET